MKYLLWIAIGFAVIWLLRGKKSGSNADARQAQESSRAGHDGQTEPVLPCVHCGVHIPASDAIRNTAGDVFCCDEHRRTHVSS